MFKSFIEEYKGKNIGLLLENEPLSKHTTFRVGGPARCLVIPNSKQSLVETMKLINKYELPFKVIGRGSNLLPSDRLFEGIIVKCDKGLDHVEIDGTQVTVGAGVSTILLANKVAKCELAGLEFISGVPGSVGGAIYMNAGAYNREIQDVLVKALILDEAGELKWLTVEEMGFSYRQSILQTHRNWIVVEAVLQLEKGSYEEIMELMKARKVRRIESQPTNLPSAGSTFRNPLPHYSWQLIEKSGLRGVRIGGAEVSQKHCNFIVNVGGATATDIYELIQHVQAVVFEKHGIQLHPEVEMFNW
ncbi:MULTISPECIES: UDP-N-acetylmuramate dehydrogenase [Turicibacter]|uniref:UDP-N-acetylenolpyruvoylglucosamine reductase n=2 Tax=Turicibacter sanguinis TaxID=154288 RepID=A0A9X5AN51_9FIRM|nr:MULTISPECIES: UDP-N-acetylmuramate dehydrogenase [Turicibacter]EFF63006.1 UDP-N-acetylmuramate dehydrogenase [Turicibacter sanguinis PC909]MBP3903601.1 UDP-N-acetylmuramate dehydrogenase [Turicibacter sp.]MCU7191216.1 UDP-N-acetylmuramate dehydrogenase [Turicibacter sanguinis]MCU7210485.1 UDP-N-acetylmuramate dehydrogenase [Turicibacter sanguinis]MDB8438363.1 UDP-N-acetylmuramate dehydrogenase [Turicibacter sanguinis]